MSIRPPVFPRSYKEAIDQNWSYVGLYPHPDMPLDLHSMWMNRGYYVVNTGFLEDGTPLVYEGEYKYALWIKKAPTGRWGRPLDFPLIEFWENWGLHNQSLTGGNSYAGKVDSITLRGNNLHVKFASRMKQEGTKRVKVDDLDYEIPLDLCEEVSYGDMGKSVVLEFPEEVVTMWRFSAATR